MPTQISTSFSCASDPATAFQEAAVKVKNLLNAPKVDLVLVFATETFASAQGLKILQNILQPEHLIGTVTPGIILGDRVEPKGVGLLAIASNELHFGAACLENLGLAPLHDAGYNFAQAMLKDHQNAQRSACLYFYDGIRRNGNILSAGIREALGHALPSVGATGVNGTKLSATQCFFQDRVLTDAVTGLLIGGTNTIAVATRHSWQPLGKPRIIDNADGNIIRTIDRQPARQLYEDYFKSTGTGLTTSQIEDIRLLYPLGIDTSTPREYLIRMPIDFADDGSILCQGEVTTGSRVHLMITDKDACRQTMRHAAMDIRARLSGKQPRLIIVLESMMRRKILGRNAVQGLKAIQEVLGHTVPIFGMYTLGETAQIKVAAPNQLLNGSVVLLAIG